MQKTRLGVTVGALGALVFFVSFFSGYLAAVILVGYILLLEENAWLRRSAVKAMVLMVLFSVASAVIGLIPDAISFIGSITAIININFSIAILSKIITVITSALKIIEKLLFLGLGLQAMSQGTIVIPFVDSMVSKFMD